MDQGYAKKLANPSKITSLSTSVFGFVTLILCCQYSKSGNVCGADALNLFKAAYYVGDAKELLSCLKDVENDTKATLTASFTTCD